MAYPPLVIYATEAEYRSHYETVYCRDLITTFDGINVRFRKRNFSHCFYESTKRNQEKDQFSSLRASRMDWIKAALKDPAADLYVGWDRKRKCYDKSHRVSVVVGNYIVVIRLTGTMKAEFVTAYVADSDSTLERIRKSPRWNADRKI